MLRLRSAWTSAILMVLFAIPAFAAEDAVKKVATVISIEGDGGARVRKKAGTESVLAAQQELSAGDKLTTGKNVLVQLMLPDGTVVRVGANTEYRVEGAEVKSGMMAWVFSLTKGTVRALVEKGPAQKETKFRVNTPAGTMGVRGTELVLSHNADSKTTTLFTIEGKVELGAKDCEKKKSCIMVTTGQSATITVGQTKPVGPIPLNMKDLVGAAMNMPSDEDQSPAAQAARAAASMMSVFTAYDSRKGGDLNGTKVQALDEAALRDMVLKTSQEMIAVQDMILDRDAATRRAMHEAIEDGTYEQRIHLAERHEEETTGKKKSAAERNDERLSGASNASKIKVSGELVKRENAKSAAQKSEEKKKDAKSGNAVSAAEMAARISASSERRLGGSSGASRAVEGSDISGLMLDAKQQMDKVAAIMANNKKALEETARKQKEAEEAAKKAAEKAAKEATEAARKAAEAAAAAQKAAEEAARQAAEKAAKEIAEQSQPAPSCAVATPARCEKAITCPTISGTMPLLCRALKSAQAGYCEHCDAFVGDYMSALAKLIPSNVKYYSGLGTAVTSSANWSITNQNRATRVKVRKCEKQVVVPCDTKTLTGKPCPGNMQTLTSLCYDLYE